MCINFKNKIEDGVSSGSVWGGERVESKEIRLRNSQSKTEILLETLVSSDSCDKIHFRLEKVI